MFTTDADHPEVLVGTDEAPSPVEHVLHGLLGCLTAGIGNIASARGIELDGVTSHVEGDIDLQGLLGLSGEVRNGFQDLRVRLRVVGDATDEELRVRPTCRWSGLTIGRCAGTWADPVMTGRWRYS